MKRAIFYILLYVVLCIVQFSFGQFLNIGGVFPNIILIAVIFVALFDGQLPAEVLGFILGLTWDIFSTDVLGARAVMFATLGYFLGTLRGSFERDQLFAQFAVSLFACITFWAGFSIIIALLPEGSFGAVPFEITFKGILKVMITVLLTPIVFGILKFLLPRRRSQWYEDEF